VSHEFIKSLSKDIRILKADSVVYENLLEENGYEKHRNCGILFPELSC
jgi:hypothetical protein